MYKQGHASMSEAGRYTPEEATIVMKAVMVSSMAVAIADLGVISTAMELAALAKELAGAGKAYPTNSIIQNVFSEEAIRRSDMGQASDVTPENATQKAIAAINEAMTLLAPKAAPQEVAEFKQFIYRCAEVVANAAGSGLFGRGDVKVSTAEAATLASLKQTLGIGTAEA
jgi:hypothetical protein